jgi:hypothetical protein
MLRHRTSNSTHVISSRSPQLSLRRPGGATDATAADLDTGEQLGNSFEEAPAIGRWQRLGQPFDDGQLVVGPSGAITTFDRVAPNNCPSTSAPLLTRGFLFCNCVE